MNIQHQKAKLLCKRDGTGQHARLLQALIDNNKLIDNKSLDEHIVFIYLYSDLLQYYQNQNKAVDHNAWRTFLEHDDTVIASLILNTNINQLKEPISNAFLALKSNKQVQPDNKHIKHLVGILEDLLMILNYWYEKSSDQSNIKLEIDNLIVHELNEPINALYQHFKQWDSQTNPSPFLGFYNYLANIWAHETPWSQTTKPTDHTLPNKSLSQAVQNTLSDLLGIIFNHITNLQKLAQEGYASLLNNERHHPQTALMIAFLRLLEYATAHINHLPQRHLDYYYRSILKFQEEPMQPDKVYVYFQLKANNYPHVIPKGTQLLAGKDQEGQAIIFETDKPITINQGTVSEIHTFQRIIQGYNTHDNLPIVNLSLASYYVEELYKQKARLNLFSQQATTHPIDPARPMGLLIASPVLQLQEGHRTIKLSFYFTQKAFKDLMHRGQQTMAKKEDTLYEAIAELFNEAIAVQVTTKEAWTTLASNALKTKLNSQKHCLELTLTLVPDVPAIVNFDSNFHGHVANMQAPSIRITLKGKLHVAHLYMFRELTLEKLNIQVQVQDFRGMILQNDLGLIDTSQPFQPFGPFPKLHANLYMGSEELFCKNLSDFKLNILWEGLPSIDDGFKGYYQAYPQKITNKSFQVNVSYLKHRQWQPFYPEHRQTIPLFEVTRSETNNAEKLKNRRIIDNIDQDKLALSTQSYTINPLLWTPKTLTGFLKLELCGPNMAFGHAIYPNLMAQTFLHKAKNKTKPSTATINEPYTPTIKTLSIDYRAQDEISFKQNPVHGVPDYSKAYIKLFPFGYKREFPNAYTKKVTFLPDTDYGEHFLTIGIKNMDASLLRIYIELDETSIHPDKAFIQPTWRYLSHNDWFDFQEKEIISDTTAGLTKSGIIVFSIPHTANKNNTLMDPGLIWLKAMFPQAITSLPIIFGIYTQAVAATRKMAGNQAKEQPTELPAYTIQSMVGNPVAIEAVTQPFPSFGGKPAEQQTNLYTRVSERLRHKNRAISTWDYERIILAQFPEISKAKCINHAQKQKPFIAQPGHITIVVIRAHQPKHVLQSMLPLASKQLLEAIKKQLQKVASPFVSLEIINPVYEEIKVNFEVKFKPGYEKGVLLNRLQKDLKTFLSPWLLNKSEDVRLGGMIPSSQIMDFISKRAYIAAIGNFSIFKYTSQGQGVSITKITDYNNYLTATYPWSVMVSSDQHKITVVDELNTQNTFRHGGVNDMRIEEDFVIGPWQAAPNKYEEQEIKKQTLQESLESYYLVTKKYIKH